jgi:hypothetical protein
MVVGGYGQARQFRAIALTSSLLIAMKVSQLFV